MLPTDPTKAFIPSIFIVFERICQYRTKEQDIFSFGIVYQDYFAKFQISSLDDTFILLLVLIKS